MKPYGKKDSLFKHNVSEKRKVKSVSRKNLVKKLDTVFSKFIRLRDSNSQGFLSCCTCNALIPWSHPKGTTHAGHYQTRNNMATRWDEKNVHGQCIKCNSFQGGKQDLHMIHIESKYGIGTAQRLRYKASGSAKFMDFELEGMIKEYNEKVKQLKKEKGI